jgi:hypothetical protein
MNTKKVATYAGALVILVIIAVLLNLNAGSRSVIHILPTTSTSTTSSTSISTSSIPTTTRRSVYTFCVPSTPTEMPIYNGNFNTGTYLGWNVTGKAFGNAPLNLTYQNKQHNYYGAPWSGYNNTFVASTFQGFVSGQGNLTSAPFQVTEPYLNFKIISAQNKGLYMEVISNNSVFEKVYFDTFNSSLTSNYFTTYLNGSINLYPLLCKNASIRIVSDLEASISSKYSYISAGNFYLGPSPVQTPGILVTANLSSNG